MKTLKHIIFPGLALVAALVSCKKETAPVSVPEEKAPQVYALSVDATKGADVKALSLDDKTLNATWAKGEKVSVYNVTKSATLGGYLEAQSAGASTTLKGSLTGTVEADDELRLSFLNPIYSAQNGTLAYIAANCDYAVATVIVASVDGGNITTAAAANFANQQAIVKFWLKDTDGNALNASSLTISAASNKLLKGMGNYTKSTTHSGYTYDNGSGGYDATQNLVDGSTGTKWCAGGEHKSDGVWYCEFHTASAVQVDGYTLTTGNDNSDWNGRNPKDWVLKAKVNSGDAWTTIATVANESTMADVNFTPYDFIVDNPGTYQYFRIEISSDRGAGTMQLSELQLWEGSYSAAYGDLTVTPASATSELTVALHNANGTDTYTLTANVGGQNYTFEKSGVNFVDGKYYEIAVKMAHAVTWTASDMSGLYVPLHGVFADNNTIKGITVTASEGGNGTWSEASYINGESGTLTFTSSVGNIKSIVISANIVDCSDSPTGWTVNGYMPAMTLSWSGTPSATVEMPIVSTLMVNNISSIVFTLE